MKKTLIAHILDQADDNAPPYIQTLREHSENVAMHCSRDMSSIWFGESRQVDWLSARHGKICAGCAGSSLEPN